MTAERLTWEEIMEKYPDRWVGLTDVEWKNSVNVKSAVVKYTDKTKSELLELQFKDEIYSIYTTPDNVFQLGIPAKRFKKGGNHGTGRNERRRGQ